ncbi:MAG: sodium:proline symporter [Planctomycetota bacterium]|nr:sodium:proline symporter [Planctomycetota bacterium]
MPLLIDAVIILIYFAVIIYIGLSMGRRENTLHDFALGGRRVPWWAVMASIIAAETSAATYLGTPGEGYAMRSLAYAQIVIGLILGRMLVGYAFLKPYYTYKVYTVYDFLGIRFGPWSKGYVSGLFLAMRTLASGTRLFVPSLVMVLAWQLLRTGDHAAGEGGFVQPTQVSHYLWAIILLTLLTCLYTAVGGIKAVIWTDVVQASLMFGTALLAIATLLYHLGGDSFNLAKAFDALTQAVPEMKSTQGYFILGWEQAIVDKWKIANGVVKMTAWEWVKLTLANPYTLMSALVANLALNAAAFGTDQDMVQRLLTAETYKKSRRSLITAAVMDLPIFATFTFIGVLLIAYYQQDSRFKPKANADVFASYILYVMPAGIRGLVLAGVFATAMGSLSAALNALATSATNDWYIPYFARHKSDRHHVAAARFFTTVFAALMIVIAAAFAYAKVTNPDVRIIPVVLGIASFILGPMLGVFLLGMFTRSRGSDAGNLIAITLGLIATIVVGELHVVIANLVAPLFGSDVTYARPAWLPKVAFTWFALIGAVVVFFVGMFFRTPVAVQEHALRVAREAGTDDRPMALRTN